MVELTLNGEKKTLEEGCTLLSFLEHLHLQTPSLAIAVNLEVIPKNRYATTVLKNGDEIEILQPVAGG